MMLFSAFAANAPVVKQRGKRIVIAHTSTANYACYRLPDVVFLHIMGAMHVGLDGFKR